MQGVHRQTGVVLRSTGIKPGILKKNLKKIKQKIWIEGKKEFIFAIRKSQSFTGKKGGKNKNKFFFKILAG
jgi:hypothetical protein